MILFFIFLLSGCFCFDSWGWRCAAATTRTLTLASAKTNPPQSAPKPRAKPRRAEWGRFGSIFWGGARLFFFILTAEFNARLFGPGQYAAFADDGIQSEDGAWDNSAKSRRISKW